MGEDQEGDEKAMKKRLREPFLLHRNLYKIPRSFGLQELLESALKRPDEIEIFSKPPR